MENTMKSLHDKVDRAMQQYWEGAITEREACNYVVARVAEVLEQLPPDKPMYELHVIDLAGVRMVYGNGVFLTAAAALEEATSRGWTRFAITPLES